MNEHRPVQLREMRGIGEAITATFTFISKNFKSFSRVLLTIVGPPTLLAAILTGYGQYGTFSFDYIEEQPLTELYSISMILSFFARGLAYIFLITTVYRYMRLYLEKEEDEEITVQEVWSGFFPEFFRVLLYSIPISIVLVIGWAFCMFPGIYLSVSLSVFFPIFFMERLDFGDGFQRSNYLITDNWWSSFVFFLLMIMITYGLGMINQVPMFVVMGLFGVVLGHNVEFFIVLMSVFSILFTAFLWSIFLVAQGIWYFNLVEEKESIGIMSKLDSIGEKQAEEQEDDWNWDF